MIYFDTAYLAKCYLNEHGSDDVRSLAAGSGRIACCAFGQLELAATLHRNLRAADALHLACALEHGFREIFSNDRHLLASAAAFKITGRNVIP